jgi:hypothetical protein
VLPLHDLDAFADAGQLVCQDHAFLLVIILFVDKLHHLVKVTVLVQLSQVIHRLLGKRVHILHDLESVLQALVVEGLCTSPQLFCLLRHDAGSPLGCFLSFCIDPVEIDQNIEVFPT